jgi:hypothetical protein
LKATGGAWRGNGLAGVAADAATPLGAPGADAIAARLAGGALAAGHVARGAGDA